MPIPEIKPDGETLKTIVTRIEIGEIKLPPFQRGFVWDQEQIISLLDSIYKNYPIGCIIVWRCGDSLPSRKNIGGFQILERGPEYPTDYVLDGQQRLTSIYGIFCKNRTIAPDQEDPIDITIFDISFDLDEKIFVPNTERNAAHKYLDMHMLFNTTEFSRAISGLEERYHAIAGEVHDRFSDYKIPLVITTKREQSEVGVIFERINNSATRLSTIDLMVAWTWRGDFHLKEKFGDILDILDEKNFKDIDEKILLQCLGSIIKKTAKTKEILSLSPDDVRNNVAKLQTGLEKAIDYLSTELKMVSKEFLPHSHQLIPLVYLFSNITPTPDQNKIIKQWFWKTSFSKRYSGSTDDKVNDDVLFFNHIMDNDFTGIGKYSYDIDKNILLNQKFTKSSPYTRAFLLLLAQKQPMDLAYERLIDLGTALSCFNRKEYHHIFPQRHLKDRQIPTEKINSICNFTFLPSDSNKKISAKSPSEYVVSIGAYADVLNSNLMPLEKKIYQKNDYDKFLNERNSVIKQYIDTLLV